MKELYSVDGKRRDLAAWRKVPKDKPWFGQIQLAGGKSNPKKWKDRVDPSTVTPPPYFPNNELDRSPSGRIPYLVHCRSCGQHPRHRPLEG